MALNKYQTPQKIRYSIDEAKKKFTKVGATHRGKRILVINYESGIDAILKVDKDKRNLESIFDPKFWSDLERNNNITVWLRKYFEY